MAPANFFIFRAVLLEILLLQSLYHHEPGQADPWLWSFLAGYGLYGAFLFWAGRRKPGLIADGLWPFLGDIAMTSLILHASGGVASDFYLAYFLVILASCLLQKASYSFLLGGAACLVYGNLVWPSLDSPQAPAYLLRLSLLLATTFLSAMVVQSIRQGQQRLIEEYQERMAWFERLSLAGRMVAAVLHDLKTPVNTILINAENTRALLGRAEQRERAERQLLMIEVEAERVSDILRDFLDFTSPSDLKLTPTPLRSLVDGAYARLTGTPEPDRIIFVNGIRPETRALASERHLLEVFINLFDNALKAMPLGGRLEVSEKLHDSRVEIRVADTGSGISPEIFPRLFEPFSSSRRDKGGHGLGLYIVRWIMERHGGNIELESDGPKKGASVILTLQLPY